MKLRAVLLIVATVLLGGMLLSGVVLAANMSCSTDPCQGTSGKDSLTGDGGINDVYGNDGDDAIKGNEGDDQLSGGADDDVLYGGDGNDYIAAGYGYDYAYGDGGDDQIEGEEGGSYARLGAESLGAEQAVYDHRTNVSRAAAAVDHLFGGPGNDTITSQDGERDEIDCGPGYDTIYIDQFDTTINCEDLHSAIVSPSGGDPNSAPPGETTTTGTPEETTCECTRKE